MKKKASLLTTRFLVILILALVMIFATISFARSLFRLTDTGVNDFYSFVGELKKATSELDSYSLRMDRETAIAFFNKDDNSAIISDYTIIKPESCQDKSCICLCEDLKKETDKRYFCYDNHCKNDIGMDFTGDCGFPIYICSQGFVLHRDLFWSDKNPAIRTVYFKKDDGKLAIYTEHPDTKKLQTAS